MADRWQMVKDREAGMTYQQIADKHGVSHQYVGMVVGKYDPKHFRFVTKEGCIYPNLREWMNENKISASELVRRLHLEPVPENIRRLQRVMRGENARKDYIDRLIEATGMRYEKLFKMEA